MRPVSVDVSRPIVFPRHARLFELIRQENLAGRSLRPEDSRPAHDIVADAIRNMACQSLKRAS